MIGQASRLTVLALFVSASAVAEPVAVKVIDVAGGAAYLSPGRAAGIVPGTKVRLRGVDTVVVEVTEKTAVVRIDRGRVAVGEAGTADVTPGAAPAARRLDQPRSPEAFAGQWSAPVLPADRQTPKVVPLGKAREAGNAHVTVTGHAFGAADRVHAAGDVEGRVIARFDLMNDRPFAADVDLAGRWFSDGFDRGTHTPLFLRAAELRYGEVEDPRLALGRLPFAAASVGMLDGGRASARLDSVELAAFGGLIPDPLSGKPDGSAARFGAELAYDAPEAAWHPRAAIAAYGSTWDGKADERRVSVAASAGRGALWLDGWGEVQAFAPDNPWRARAVELTGAGASAEWSKHGSYAGADVTFLRPERSLRLAARLPPEWLCTLGPGVGAGPAERCARGDWWGAATASLGTRTAHWAIDAAGTLGDSHGEYRGFDRSGYLRAELREGPARLAAGVAGGQASFASWTAGELGVAYAPSPALGVTLAYRPELLDYAASTGPALVHSVIADAQRAISPALDLTLSVIGTTGAGVDRDALAILATFVWRPLP